MDRHRADYDAFLVIHGTDTMAFTASALSLMLLGFKKPIVRSRAGASGGGEGAERRRGEAQRCGPNYTSDTDQRSNTTAHNPHTHPQATHNPHTHPQTNTRAQGPDRLPDAALVGAHRRAPEPRRRAHVRRRRARAAARAVPGGRCLLRRQADARQPLAEGWARAAPCVRVRGCVLVCVRVSLPPSSRAQRTSSCQRRRTRTHSRTYMHHAPPPHTHNTHAQSTRAPTPRLTRPRTPRSRRSASASTGRRSCCCSRRAATGRGEVAMESVSCARVGGGGLCPGGRGGPGLLMGEGEGTKREITHAHYTQLHTAHYAQLRLQLQLQLQLHAPINNQTTPSFKLDPAVIRIPIVPGSDPRKCYG